MKIHKVVIGIGLAIALVGRVLMSMIISSKPMLMMPMISHTQTQRTKKMMLTFSSAVQEKRETDVGFHSQIVEVDLHVETVRVVIQSVIGMMYAVLEGWNATMIVIVVVISAALGF